MKKDRLSMLKKLTFIGEKNINIFSSYIPDHYDEIYTLYDLLNKASLNYFDIEFSKPIEKDESFIFVCNMPLEYSDSLKQYLIDNGNIIKCMRNKPFNVYMKDNKSIIHIKFKKM